ILFNDKYEVTPEIEHLENIAQKLVLSNKKRPAWDVKALKECGYNLIRVEEDMGRYVWDEKQKVEQKSRPLFMVVAK
ncbi:MAG TPA: SAM-dependent methyltransferase, partial [Terrisporobacter glycolicus]|nr:SAM-dependent methyltransferase [Terrisporobacter hibernicus]